MPECPIDCPNRRQTARTRQESAGMAVAAFAIAAFIWMWAIRGVVERKAPTPFEIILAVCSLTALLIQPDRVAAVGAGAIAKVLGSEPDKPIDP